MGVSVFRHILHLPPVLMERAPIGAQVARIREFESLRDFFTSPLATVFLELPFVVIFLIAIALLGGWLVLIPLIMVVMFLLTGFVLTPHLRRRVQDASRARSKRHGFLVEALTRMHDIKRLGAETIWFERFRTLSADAAAKDLHSRILSSLLQTASHLIMTAAAIATLAFGALLVMGGHMTSGALIATRSVSVAIRSTSTHADAPVSIAQYRFSRSRLASKTSLSSSASTSSNSISWSFSSSRS